MGARAGDGEQQSRTHDTRIQIQDGIVPLMVEGGRRGANEGAFAALTLTRLVPHAANALLC